MKKHPIVFFCTDQQRFDSLSCCGNLVARTPNIDRLAQGGTQLRRHIAPVQICAPTRASIFTGQYPRDHGLVCNGIALDPSCPTFVERLTDYGYRTHGIGKFHLQPLLAPPDLNLPESYAFWHDPARANWTGPYYGFQTVEFVLGDAMDTARGGHYAAWLQREHSDAIDMHDPNHARVPPPDDYPECYVPAIPVDWHYDSWIADRAVEFLDHIGRTPFFLWISFPDPHHPFAPPWPYCDVFDPNDVPLPSVVESELERMPDYYRQPADPFEQGGLTLTRSLSESTMRRIIAYTYGLVNLIDDCVGRVLSKLDDLGLVDDTHIVFTSDHGELLGDHGLLKKGPPPYRQLMEVPCLIRGPKIPAGRHIEALTSHVDLAATILDLAGIEPSSFTGRHSHSLMPLLNGQMEKVRDHAYFEYYPRGVLDLYNQSIRNDRWRMTIYPQHPEWGELFDLQSDSFEHHNIFYDATTETVIQDLKGLMKKEFPPHPVVPQLLCQW